MGYKRRVALTTLVLILAQVQLLFLSELHHHKISLPGLVCAQSSVQSKSESPGTGEAGDLCLACLIVRQNAVRPATGAPTPRPLVAAYFRPAFSMTRRSSYQPSLIFGRAPPSAVSLGLS
jgi:hypothetical protein